MFIPGKGPEAQTARAAATPASARSAPGPQPSHKLYSIAGLLRKRSFEGHFNARGENYHFAYVPTEASISGGKVELTGRLSVRGPRGAARGLHGVRARLTGTQGGIGASPARRQLIAGSTGGANLATPGQQQEQVKAPELVQEPVRPVEPIAPRVPVTQSTGAFGFVGVLYFRLQPLNGSALGVPLDLSSVQLNARLAPDNDTDRDLLWLYSDLVAALYGGRANESAAAERLKELNALLQGA